MTARRVALGAAWLGAFVTAVTGVWALVGPRSFFEVLAPYPPYHRHLFHDVGAFQLGISAALLAGLARRTPVAVGLWGGAVGATLHAVSHWMDAGLGGRPSDPWLLTLLAAVLIVGLISAEMRK